MKHILFMNPRTRRRSARRVRARSHRRVYRNPHHLSAAHKRKISLAVKRAMASRKSGGSRRVKARRIRRVARPVARRVVRRSVRRSARRSASRAIVRYRNRFVRRSSRRRSHRSSFGRLSLRGILSKDNVVRGAGVVGASVVTTWVMQNYGAKLPGVTNQWVRAAYAVAIPVAGAYLVKRVSPKLAEGMLLGAIASGIIQLLSASNVAIPGIPLQGVSAYLGQNRRVRGASGFLTGTPAGSRVGTPSVQALNSFGAGGSVYDSAPAFKPAWAR